MATRYRLYVVDMADRKAEDFKHELGELYGVRVLTLDPIELVPIVEPTKRKRPKPRIGTTGSLGEAPHASSGQTTTSKPRRSVMLCASCQSGKCASCLYPFDCPCVSPMHNGAPFERVEIEAITV